MIMIDSHIHVGQYFSYYFSPEEIATLMRKTACDYYVVSSTSICEENYVKVLEELHELIRLDGTKVLPTMWITPLGIKGNIAWFLESDIKWRSLKVHPELHPNDWNPTGNQFAEVIDIAKELKIPLLIHTGEKECCYAKKYEPLIADNPEVNIILAHGRPHEQALELIGKYDNVYVDSAFMPITDMIDIVHKGFSSKLLWGTDMCIPKYYYPKNDMFEYYQKKLKAFKERCVEEIQYEKVVYENAVRVFNI